MYCLNCMEAEEIVPGAGCFGNADPNIPFDARERIKMVCAFIDRMYTEDVSRGKLAYLFNINKDTLSRHFNRYTGMRLNDYINKLRIMHTARLLKETDYSVTYICIISGFENVRTFNRLFRKEFLLSPSGYRKIYSLGNFTEIKHGLLPSDQ